METKDPRFRCYKCGEELVFDVKIGRRDMCPNCYAYLHCCYNCRFWNPDVHNQCTENQGEFIRDRTEGNFCLYFTFKAMDEGGAEDEASKAKDRLSKMFGGGKPQLSPRSSDEARERLDALFGKRK
ncbi:MAG: hypothetical protein FJ087_10055 [Deltaproteobacteria bacterium]|nr:hypothetical protein [Deltaproteobacteria bacterium]